jgi:hypothetical protein
MESIEMRFAMDRAGGPPHWQRFKSLEAQVGAYRFCLELESRDLSRTGKGTETQILPIPAGSQGPMPRFNS